MSENTAGKVVPKPIKPDVTPAKPPPSEVKPPTETILGTRSDVEIYESLKSKMNAVPEGRKDAEEAARTLLERITDSQDPAHPGEAEVILKQKKSSK